MLHAFQMIFQIRTLYCGPDAMYTFQFVETSGFAIFGEDTKDVIKDIKMIGHPKFSC